MNGLNYAGSGAANSLGYTWDNNSSTTYNYVTGLSIPSNQWSMVALAVSPSNSVFYVANTNAGLITATQNMLQGGTNAAVSTNSYQSWGGSMTIGSDLNSVPGRNFGGFMSSVVMFTNTLSYAQIAALYDAGLAQSNQAPVITQNPLPAQFLPASQLPAGFSINASFAAGGYGGTLVNGSYWQVKYPSSSGWVTLVNGANNGGGIASGTQAANTNAMNLSSTLMIAGATAADAGSYQLVLTNAAGVSATSAVATLSFISTAVQANSFEQYALTNGIVAFWPLNEAAVDPSSGVAEAYDIVGGFNGLYGVNAANGHANAADGFAAVPGPAAAGLAGFAAGSALGSQQNGLANTYVTTVASPTFPPASNNAGTNLTIIAWIKPNTNENASTGLLMQRTGSQVDGLIYGSAVNTLGYNWDNNPVTYGFAGPAIKTNTWSMVAMVVTSNDTVLYVGNSNSVVLADQKLALASALINTNQTWGGPLAIGGDPIGGGLARYFGGSMSSVAMFSNALTTLQIEGLYVAGQDAGAQPAPVITANPPAPVIQIIPGLTETLTAAGFAALPAGGFWQKSTTAGVWNTLANGGNISGATTFLSGISQQGALVVGSVSSADVGSYHLVVTEWGRFGDQQRRRPDASCFRSAGEQLRRNRHQGGLRRGGLLALDRDGGSFQRERHRLRCGRRV